MRILFLHNNFPAQFGAFGQFLARKGWDVTFGTQRKSAQLDGISVFSFAPHRKAAQEIHPYAVSFERAVLNGQAVARACLNLAAKGYQPDIVIAHSGWGPGLFVKDVWPDTIYIGYFEWYYQADAPDIAFLRNSDLTPDERLRSRARNAPILVDLASCDAGLCPTVFQKAQFPQCFDEKLKVMHDGIDTDYFKPERGARLALPGLDFAGAKELITYVARGMEPYRGFPEFMAAIEIVLKSRPHAHVVIVGKDRVAYGKQLPDGDTYKQRALRHCDIDWSRVRFTGLLPRAQYRHVLQASSVHVYLTAPFVLSWSMLEAMSAGCAIVASDVEPVREISQFNPRALKLVDTRNIDEIAGAICATLDVRTTAMEAGNFSRSIIREKFSADELMSKKLAWLSSLPKRIMK